MELIPKAKPLMRTQIQNWNNNSSLKEHKNVFRSPLELKSTNSLQTRILYLSHIFLCLVEFHRDSSTEQEDDILGDWLEMSCSVSRFDTL